jgi:hypothetical protein
MDGDGDGCVRGSPPAIATASSYASPVAAAAAGGEQAVGEAGHHQAAHVVGRQEVAAVHQRVAPRRAQQPDGAARAGARAEARDRAGGVHDGHQVVHQRRVRVHLSTRSCSASTAASSTGRMPATGSPRTAELQDHVALLAASG